MFLLISPVRVRYCGQVSPKTQWPRSCCARPISAAASWPETWTSSSGAPARTAQQTASRQQACGNTHPWRGAISVSVRPSAAAAAAVVVAAAAAEMVAVAAAQQQQWQQQRHPPHYTALPARTDKLREGNRTVRRLPLRQRVPRHTVILWCAQLRIEEARGYPLDHPCSRKRPCFVSFSCLYPEPVLANIRLFSIKRHIKAFSLLPSDSACTITIAPSVRHSSRIVSLCSTHVHAHRRVNRCM